MKTPKKILIAAAVLLLVLAGAIFFLLRNLDSIVKTAIEKYGSETTKTSVRVSSVKIKLSSGEGAIKGLTVSNPKGFSSSKIFSLGEISTKIDIRSVRSKIIIIDSIIISAPQVLYEMNSSGGANIDALKKNIQSAGNEKKPEKKEDGGEIRLHIKKLVIQNGKINLRLPTGSDKPSVINLPRVELTDIGKKGGATSSQVAAKVASALTEEVAVAVAKEGAGSFFGSTFKKLFGK